MFTVVATPPLLSLCVSRFLLLSPSRLSFFFSPLKRERKNSRYTKQEEMDGPFAGTESEQGRKGGMGGEATGGMHGRVTECWGWPFPRRKGCGHAAENPKNESLLGLSLFCFLRTPFAEEERENNCLPAALTTYLPGVPPPLAEGARNPPSVAEEVFGCCA